MQNLSGVTVTEEIIRKHANIECQEIWVEMYTVEPWCRIVSHSSTLSEFDT